MKITKYHENHGAPKSLQLLSLLNSTVMHVGPFTRPKHRALKIFDQIYSMINA